MRPRDKIERYIKNTKVKTNPEVNRAVLNDLLDHLETGRAPQAASPQLNLWRTIMENRTFRISTAAAILLVAALIGISQLVFVTPTFAQIVEPILNAKTIAFDMTVGSEDDGIVMHDRIKGSRIRRTLSNMPGNIMIIDTQNARMLNLTEEKGNVKTAAYIDTEGPLQEGQKNFLAFIREVIIKIKDRPGFEPTSLDKQEIDGRKVIGYAADSDTEHVKVWADAETLLPVRVELGVGQQAYVIKNFEFDIPISDAEVSMEVPEGYTVKETPFDFSNVTEANLVESLRVWATVLQDNRFPDELSTQAYMTQVPLLEQKIGPLELSQAEKEQMGVNFIQGMLFLQTFELHHKGPWHYAGKGVKFGQADKPIFWYRPADSQLYRVIYGDLSIREVAEPNLPRP
jgi:outer membrane lipoprotein-sorting protein